MAAERKDQECHYLMRTFGDELLSRLAEIAASFLESDARRVESLQAKLGTDNAD